MEMVSMKTDSDDAMPTSEYGYGLSINLTEDQVEALGLKENPPAAGSKVTLHAFATVTRVSQDADIDGDGDGVDVCLSFQITDLKVENTTGPSAATLLYGAKNGN